MKSTKKTTAKKAAKHTIRRGDTVMVIAGGNSKNSKRVLKGQIGKVARFVGEDRVVVEGLNMVTRHQRALGPDKPAGKVQKEAPIHVSNVMYYAEKIKRPVRLKHKLLADGKKVRGYVDSKTKQFEQID
jgi:large subunit ribosomal protein L24